MLCPVEDIERGGNRQQAISNGFLDADGEEGSSKKNQFWNQRTYTIRLDKFGSQLIADQLKNEQLALSVAYAFVAEGVSPDMSDTLEIEGTPEEVKEFQRLFKDHMRKADNDSSLITKVVYASAFGVQADINKWPELVTQLDVNESLPPAYASMDVRCYDFKDRLRPDLFQKVFEARAIGVNGEVVSARTNFSNKQVDLYKRRIVLPKAIQLKEPFAYRIIEVSQAGKQMESKWQVNPRWKGTIDISTEEDAGELVLVRVVEVELDPELLQKDQFKGLHFKFRTQLGMEEVEQKLSFLPADREYLKSVKILHNQNSSIHYCALELADGSFDEKNKHELLDDYIYIK